MAFETIDFRVKDGIARLTLDRTDAANAMNMALGRELFEAAIVCDESADIRAVLLTGAGKKIGRAHV